MDEYINSFDEEIKQKLLIVKKTIKEIVPDAIEVISYNMPAFKLKENLVYFASCKNYIGFYPTNEPIEYFKEELKNYKTTKGSIHFDKEIPVDLIQKIVKYRLEMIKRKIWKNT